MNQFNYKSFFEQLPILQLVMDAELNIVTASDLFLTTTKTTLKNITGKNIFTAFPQNPLNKASDGENKIQQSLNKVLKHKLTDKVTVVKNDLKISTSDEVDNQTKYWKLSHSPILDEANNVKFIVQIAEDATENETLAEKPEADKKNLLQIKENNLLYYKMLVDSPFAFSIMEGDDLKITVANDLMKTFWGKGKNIEGKSLLDVLPEFKDQPFPEMILEVYKTGKPKYLNEILAKINYNDILEDKYFNIVYQPYFEAFETITGVTTIAYEVTEIVMARKKIEETQIFNRSVLEHSPDCIKIIDKNGRVEYINDNGLCLLELDNIDEVKNKFWWDLWEDQDKPMIQQAVSKALNQQKVHFQASFNTAKGTSKWWDIIVLPLRVDEATNKAERLLTVSRDITDYKIANLKILEGEHRYRQMIYSSPFLIAILKGKNFIIEIANDAILEVWAKGKNVIGKSLLAVLPEIIDQGFAEILNNVFATGETFEAHDMPIELKRNGVMEMLYFSFVYQPQKNVDGVIDSIALIAHEVTPQAIINKNIKASEEQFRLLVQQAPVAICVLRGSNYLVETVNEPMAQLWNRELTDVINKPVFDVLIELRDQGFKELLDNVFATGVPFVAEELPVDLLRNGIMHNAFVKFVYEPLRDGNGSITGVMALATEITDQVIARKKIEESAKRFRQMADMMPSKISNADEDGKLLYLNEKWLDYTGKTVKELQGLDFNNIMHPDEVEAYTNNFLHAAETGTVLKMEMRFLDKHGNYKWHLNLASPIKDEQGKIVNWLGSTLEIDEQVAQKELLKISVKDRTIKLEIANKELLYQNLEKEKRSAELAIANIELAFQNGEKEKRSAELLLINKELQSFTYVASHDLQEPLRKINFFAERILDTEFQNLTDTGRDYFKRMQSAAIRMRQLIEDLLSFSRINIIDRKMELTDLSLIVQEVEEELRESAENKHIIINVKSSCEVNVIVFQFRQLLHNLLGNSLKFAQQDVIPSITINSHIAIGKNLNNEELIAENSYCHISIKDNGIGFEPEYSKRIFEVFQKLHSRELYKGTGIGLAIVKKIVDNHNGIITATSELGEGALFDIYLPL